MHLVHQNRTGQPWDKPGHDEPRGQKGRQRFLIILLPLPWLWRCGFALRGRARLGGATLAALTLQRWLALWAGLPLGIRLPRLYVLLALLLI
jgi:hypothetical protein